MHALYDEWLKLATHIGRVCIAEKRVIAGAESCTGGLISAVLTGVSGSSAWVDRGFVTYSNEAKMELLGVLPGTLDTYGAVSEETAREMARGALSRSGASIAYSVTGVAGPTGGTASKPVGMVCFGFATADDVFTATQYFAGDRNSVREQSVNFVLHRLAARR
ncbi:MAG: CinA family protein [Burkholderiales bacterium]|nr:CinA family protein [Burkholderiales bacterium]